MIYLAAALSMALKDFLATMLVIAESRGRAVLAGTFDALGDLAVILCTIFGAGEVILHGLTARTVGIVAVMVVTSFFGTLWWTRVGRKMKAQP